MKPLKITAGLSRWLLRVSLAVILFYKHLYTIAMFNLNDYHLYLSIITAMAAIGLFVGGFFKRNNVTVISSLLIVLLLITEVFIAGGIILTNTFYLKLSQFFIAFYFLSNGNNK